MGKGVRRETKWRNGTLGVLVSLAVGCGVELERPANTLVPPAEVTEVEPETSRVRRPGPADFGEVRLASVVPGPKTPPPGPVCTLKRYIDGVLYACHPVQGTFTNQFLAGEPCLPTSATCTTGELMGGLDASYEFFFLSQVPSGDPGNPQRELFVGETTVTTEDGLLFGDDFGTFDFSATGPASFRTLIDVQDGTGEFEDARGHLLAVGEVDLVTGAGGGTYSGEVCTPAERQLHAGP